MAYVLNLAYLAGLVLLSPFLFYRVLVKGKYRYGFGAKFFGLVPRRKGDAFCLWLHAVSVGEVKLLAPLLDKIGRQFPDWQCVISTTTKTGYDLAVDKYDGVTVFYCPLDFSWATRTAMRRMRPDLLLLTELELWPNLISAASRRGARVGVINGRLSEKSYRGYRRLGFITRRMLGQLDVIATQNEEYAERFIALGADEESVHVTGSLKFDDAQTNRENPATQWLRQLAGFHEDDIVFLAGSTQKGEEKMALKAFQKLRDDHPQLRLVLVPRHPERFEQVARLLDKSRIPWIRRTELTARSTPTLSLGGASLTLGGTSAAKPSKKKAAKTTRNAPDDGPRILLVDTIGELSAWWGTADIAYVGGSMGRRGGQNMIEPAAYGAAVSFGPKTRNFRDIVAAMREAKAAVVVTSGKKLLAFVRRCLEQPMFAKRLGKRAQTLVARQQGATENTLYLLEELLEDAPSKRRAA